MARQTFSKNGWGTTGKWMTPQTKLDSMRNSKKKLRVKYKNTMAQMAMIAGLGVLCLSSSVGAALMMGGGKEEGAVCTPEGTPDPNATYKYDANDACVMSCKTG